MAKRVSKKGKSEASKTADNSADSGDISREGEDFASMLDSETAALNFGDDKSAEIEALQAQVKELQDRALRAQAEAENTRERLTRERQELQKYAVTPLAMEMFEVGDNLHQALSALPKDWQGDKALAEFIKGLSMTADSLATAFQRCHIRRIGEVGEKFDYNLHQALSEVESKSAKSGTIITVVRHGYVLHERLLRAASVIIAK